MACNCVSGIGNFGIPKCMDEVMDYVIGIISVPLTDDGGNKNGITKATDTLNESFFVDKFNESDGSKRWHPITGLKDVTPVVADSNFKDYSDGSQAFLNKGVFNFKGTLRKVSFTFAGQFESSRCVEHGYYLITNSGQLVGYDSADGLTLLPIAADKESADTKAVFATAGSNPQEIELNFNFKQSVKVERLATVLDSEIVGYDLTEAKGLLNVTATITDIVATGYTATLTLTDFGSYNKEIAVEQWADTDFALFNQTTASVVTIVSSTEGAAGVYAQVIAAQTAADVLDLDSAVTTGIFVKKGYQLPETLFVAV